jgi:hypothetical protein
MMADFLYRHLYRQNLQDWNPGLGAINSEIISNLGILRNSPMASHTFSEVVSKFSAEMKIVESEFENCK